MEAERKENLKKVLPKLALGFIAVESFTLPIFRSGGKNNLSFWGFIYNHTIFGSAVEYVPEEDYQREIEGVFPWDPVKAITATSVNNLVKKNYDSVIVNGSNLKLYSDILANVRYDGKYHSIKSLVKPDDAMVKDVARQLIQSKDFISVSQQFVNSFTTYKREIGDYWRTPDETLDEQSGDCDDKAILLCSILRNYMPADQVYCAYGLWTQENESEGHMWVVVEGDDGNDRIVEATAGPDNATIGNYVIHGIFNDKLAFSTDVGLREFGLKAIV